MSPLGVTVPHFLAAGSDLPCLRVAPRSQGLNGIETDPPTVFDKLILQQNGQHLTSGGIYSPPGAEPDSGVSANLTYMDEWGTAQFASYYRAGFNASVRPTMTLFLGLFLLALLVLSSMHATPRPPTSCYLCSVRMLIGCWLVLAIRCYARPRTSPRSHSPTNPVGTSRRSRPSTTWRISPPQPAGRCRRSGCGSFS